MTPTKTAAILRRLADDWRHEEAQLCTQFGDVVLPQSMRARRIKDTEAIDAAVEMIDRLEAAESEAIEQARLNGMGSEREAALMAKLKAAEKERDELMAALQHIADGQDMSGVFTFADVVLRYQEIARAAIARATGESK